MLKVIVFFYCSAALCTSLCVNKVLCVAHAVRIASLIVQLSVLDHTGLLAPASYLSLPSAILLCLLTLQIFSISTVFSGIRTVFFSRIQWLTFANWLCRALKPSLYIYACTTTRLVCAILAVYTPSTVRGLLSVLTRRSIRQQPWGEIPPDALEMRTNCHLFCFLADAVYLCLAQLRM